MTIDGFPGLTGDDRIKTVRRYALERQVQAFAGQIENISSVTDAELYGIRDRIRSERGWKMTESEQVAICQCIKDAGVHYATAIITKLDRDGPLGPSLWSQVSGLHNDLPITQMPSDPEINWTDAGAFGSVSVSGEPT